MSFVLRPTRVTLTRVLSPALVLLVAFACGCATVGTSFTDQGRDVDATTEGGFDVPQQQDTPPDQDAAPQCVTDEECFGNPNGTHCDRTSQTCRQCLPNPNTCTSGQYCSDAFLCVAGCSADVDCTGPDGGTDGGTSLPRCDVANHRCVECLGDPDCSGDLVCGPSHTCVMGCSAVHPCPSGSDCCGTVCVSLLTEPTHCGSCAHACDPGGSCCGGVCFDLAGDPRHCGTCTNRCVAPNATAACTAGACTVGTCLAGYGDCDGNPANGCETLLTNDTAHCGACATTCPAGSNGTALCVGSICTFNCSSGYLHCSSNPADGCESNPQTDVMNCGACGHACTSAHSTGGCVGGVCTIGACTAGYADCDGNPANGCESTTASDPVNCGSCFRTCPTGANSVPVCTASVCSVTCRAGYGNCNAVAADGCEANFAADPAHCGSCTTACPTRPNATATCSATTCGFICSVGFRDCNAVATDGCEANVRTSATNCGSCGNVCTAPNATPACSAGGCAIGSCNPGYSDCDGLVANGCEIHSAVDSSNCGACGTVCTGGTTCVSGVCTLVNPFPSTGTEGAFAPSANIALTPGVHNFTTINIPAGVTVTVSLGAASNGVLDLRATGDVTIAGTINLSGGVGGNGVRGTGGGGGGYTGLQQTAAVATAGLGGSAPAGSAAVGCGANAVGGTNGGGPGTQGNGTVGGGGGGGPGGGAGGLIGGTCVAGAGGGGATAGAGGQSGGPPYDGVPGQSGTDACAGLAAGGGGGSIGMAATADFGMATTFAPGSGGGGGSASYGTGLSAAEGGGGGGGGAVRLSSPTRITVSGTIRVDGGRGGNGSDGNTTCALYDGGAGGGGGSGGAIYLASPSVSVTATGVLSAAGGVGGARGANVSGGDGGAGGLGRIRLSVSSATCTLSGTFSPPLRSACASNSAGGNVYIATYPR